MKNTLLKGLLLFTVGGLMTSCGGGGGSSSPAAPAASTTVTLTGTLKVNGSSLGSASGQSLNGSESIMAQMVVSKKTDVAALTASYKVACVTFEDEPKSCNTPVGTDGSFSASCTGFAGIPFGCFVYNTTTFKNYSIVFNVSNDSSNSVNSSAGTAQLGTVDLDTTTGLATLPDPIVLPTSTVATPTPVAVADISNLDGTYKMAGAPWAQVSSKYTDEEKSILKGIVYFYKQNNPSCPTGTENGSDNTWDNTCKWTPSTEEQGYDFAISKMSGSSEYTAAAAILAGTFTLPTVDSTPMQLYFKGMSETNSGVSKPKLTVWASKAAYDACTATGQMAFRITKDGTPANTVNIDMPTTVSASTDANVSANLLAYLSTQMGTAITKFAPVLDVLDMGAQNASLVTGNVTCKIPYDVDWRFYNQNPAQLALCEADTSTGGCKSLKNQNDQDYFNALQRYKMNLLYSGADASSNAIIKAGLDCPVTGTSMNPVCNFNFANNLVSDSTTVGYGITTGWTSAGPTITASNDVSWKDLGGCIQWTTGSDHPKIIPQGQFFTQLNNGVEVSQKCTWNERRLVAPGTSTDYQFQLTVDGSPVYYKDATAYIAVSGTNKQVWSQICQISYNSNTWVEQYPIGTTKATIVQNYNDRSGGRGTADDRKGQKFGVLYRWLAGNDGPSGGYSVSSSTSFSYPTGPNSWSNYTCQQLVQGHSSLDWNNIGSVVQNMHDDYSLAAFMSCLLVGLANDTNSQYTTMFAGWSPTLGSGDVAIKAALTSIKGNAAYQDTTGNNVPDIIDTLAANSCVPRVQMTRICTSSGCGNNRVICSTGSKANGGCDKPEPATRMANMDVTPIGSGKYIFFNKEERYDYSYDPSSNSGRVCSNIEAMTITNQTAVTAATAVGDVISMMFDSKSARICDGDDPKPSAEPKKFMQFKKIQ